ncbi:hypothetical protein MYCTH_2313111 [Thermothelomyces thermophilus ATCC 42464]|uniref:Uncharacterized protein n=1 Tax=Thermothelomyces thermophilus (strain ATCC 42464 / BCRC 31852 / DSM 1799) TaxID=573729 RepID=G2QNT1_THET4|nr:uncharacterized protein MYCTH_2313111 [Thermothelomyces thermophilus ATCC 42464]AEO62107.1 hypothetical protein MYCTH_2313111 [Thermothelomyces thermophilus ATCC 42464]
MGNRSSRRKGGERPEATPPDGERQPSLDGNGDGSEAVLPPRYAACELLYKAGIPAAVWLEDALSRHGVPTLVFDLFLLVPDVDAAAQVLIGAGYRRGQLSFALRNIRQFENLYFPPRAITADNKHDESIPDTGVILLAAREWFHELPATAQDMTDWFPTLPQLLTALIAKWLSLEEQESDLRLRIAVYIGYIYLYIDAVKEPGFQEQLPPEYRLFHADRLQGINTENLGEFQCQQLYLQRIKAAE